MKNWLPLLLSAVLLAGCVPLQPRATDVSELEKETAPREVLRPPAPAPLPPPAFVEQLAPPGATLETAPPEKLFTFSFSAVPLSQVLQAVLGEAGISLSVDAGVDLARPVTVHLKNGTLREALDLIVSRGAGCVWTLRGSQLEIGRFEERLYRLDYLDVATTSDIDVGGDMLASSISQSGVTGKFQVKGKRDVKKADIWEQVQKVLEGLKSKDGILQINPTAGLVYLADTPGKIATMVRFLDGLKESLNRQVLIEAKILDVQLKDSFRYGINWESIQASIDPGNFPDRLLPDLAEISFNGNGLIIANETTALGAIVDFLSTQGDVTVLSNPHLSVMNGQPAVMTVGSQFPFADITGVSRDEETNVVTIDGTIKRAVFGLQLGITPQIAGDGMITLHVVPTITRQEGMQTVEFPVGGVGVQTIENPIIGLQELATTVRVRDGQSVVLAGLISQEKSQTTAGLPWLRRIPGAGFFFGNGEELKTSRELVILIRPRLIPAI